MLDEANCFDGGCPRVLCFGPNLYLDILSVVDRVISIALKFQNHMTAPITIRLRGCDVVVYVNNQMFALLLIKMRQFGNIIATVDNCSVVCPLKSVVCPLKSGPP